MASNVTYSAAYLAESKATLINTMYSIPIPLEIFSTAIRLWARLHTQSGEFRLAFDDYFMIFATVVGVAECITGLVYGPPYAFGRHVVAVSEYDLRMFLQGDYIFSHFYNIAIAVTKLSVLALYYRIFATRQFRIIVLAVAAFVCAWIVVMEVVLGFGCWPIDAWWDVTKGKCIDKEAFTYFTNVTNLVADLCIFIMPIPVLLGLKTTKDKRMSLCFLFSVGLGTCVISAARLSFVFGVGSADYTWNETGLGILSVWEPCGGILCANLPLIYRTLVTMMSKVRATARSSNSRSGPTMGGGSERPGNKVSLHRDWTRLTNSDGNGTTTEVTASKRPCDSTEMDTLKPGAIVVRRDFMQASLHSVVLEDDTVV